MSDSKELYPMPVYVQRSEEDPRLLTVRFISPPTQEQEHEFHRVIKHFWYGDSPVPTPATPHLTDGERYKLAEQVVVAAGSGNSIAGAMLALDKPDPAASLHDFLAKS